LKNVRAVILAAGQGKRMESVLSKLAHPVHCRSLVEFPAKACLESGIGKTIVVVGHQAEKIKSILGDEFTYVSQEKRLGTGDALKKAAPSLKDSKGELVVLPGDAPFITASMLMQLVHYHRERNPAATVLTALLADPSYYGRVIRDGYLGVKRIVEVKDAKPEELKIKEVNSGIYCFDTQRVLPLLFKLTPSKVTREYYLTDVISLMHKQGLRVEALKSEDPTVILGVNTREELRRADQIMRRRQLDNMPKNPNSH